MGTQLSLNIFGVFFDHPSLKILAIVTDYYCVFHLV